MRMFIAGMDGYLEWVCEDASSRVLSLPMHAAMSDVEVESVVTGVTSLVSDYAR
jgi:dTDP-4-amino-4,6-dideoxygalactose transaminase